MCDLTKIKLSSLTLDSVDKFITALSNFDLDSILEKGVENEFLTEITLVIGLSAYTNRRIKNTGPFGIYSKYYINEVAFLCNSKTLDFCSVVGIFTGNIKVGAKLVSSLITNNLVDKFAKYLWVIKHVLLINIYYNNSIDLLLDQYKNHKILVCCSGINLLQILTKVNYAQLNGKYLHILKLCHPSSSSYRNGWEKACSCYLDHSYQDPKSNLKIEDFYI